MKDIKEYQRQYRLKNKEKICQQNREWVANNREYIREKARDWYSLNKGRVSASHKKSYQKNKDKWRPTRARHYNENKERKLENARMASAIRRKKPQYKISNSLRCGLYNALKGAKKHAKTLELLGCTIQEFKYKLEKRFTKEMTWDNYGAVWHIDHIIPVSKLDLTQEAQQKICFHYTNMQPMLAAENMKKRAKVLFPKQLPLL